MKLRYIGEPAGALANREFWEPGEEREIEDPAEAALYLRNANWREVQEEVVEPTPKPQSAAVTPPPKEEG